MPVDVNWKGVRVASVNRLEAAFTRHSKVAIMFVAKKPGKHRNVPLLAVGEFPEFSPPMIRPWIQTAISTGCPKFVRGALGVLVTLRSEKPTGNSMTLSDLFRPWHCWCFSVSGAGILRSDGSHRGPVSVLLPTSTRTIQKGQN